MKIIHAPDTINKKRKMSIYDQDETSCRSITRKNKLEQLIDMTSEALYSNGIIRPFRNNGRKKIAHALQYQEQILRILMEIIVLSFEDSLLSHPERSPSKHCQFRVTIFQWFMHMCAGVQKRDISYFRMIFYNNHHGYILGNSTNKLNDVRMSNLL